MGNCLVSQLDKIIKVMKTDDGKVVEYRAPIKVHDQVLSDFSVLPAEEEEEEKKRVRFVNPLQDIAAGQEGSSTGVVRIKLVITKQELEMMLSRGALSLDDMISHLQHRQINLSNEAQEFSNYKLGWKPTLQSIPE